MPDDEISLPNVKLREDPKGKTWTCTSVVQSHMPSYRTRTYWEVRNPDGDVVASGMRATVKEAHSSALQACKRRWSKLSDSDK